MVMSYKEITWDFSALVRHILKNVKMKKQKLQQLSLDYSLTAPHIETIFTLAHHWLK